jgi:dTDP-4-dehydrorhamnose reductase
VNTETFHLRVAVTGASGLLGRALVHHLIAQGHHVVAGVHRVDSAIPDRATKLSLDLLDRTSVQRFVEESAAGLIIHSAAMTDVDGCEREPAEAESLNSAATEHLMDAVANSDCRVVYISTDYVFDGRSGPKHEDDSPAPINVYGRTKLQGEEVVREAGEQHAIVRSSSFLGVGTTGHPTFAEAMVRRMQADPPLMAATDQRSNITSVEHLAAAIVEIGTHGYNGIWHVAGEEILSRYRFALQLARLFDLDDKVVEPVKYERLNRAAPRPLDGGLLTNRHLATAPMSLSDSLTRWRIELRTRKTLP